MITANIKAENGMINANPKMPSLETKHCIDTIKFAFGRYYKFDIPNH